jgi:hypothetical protein
MFAALLCAGCGGGGGGGFVPQPSPEPPAVFGTGTLAVILSGSKVFVYPPNGDKPAREFSLPGFINSLAFDRRRHLYIGFNHGDYFVRDVDLQTGDRARLIDLQPGWNNGSVAVDSENVLYVNTKSSIGGDVKLFRTTDVKPYLEIKDALTPLRIQVARNALWVSYYGLLTDAIGKYNLRSTKRANLQNVGAFLGTTLAVNPGGSLVATSVRRHGNPTVAVYDLGRSNWKTIVGSSIQTMVSDDDGNLYVGLRNGRILQCTFSDCPYSFETNVDITALALSPLDGMLYVGSAKGEGRPAIYVYNPRTSARVRTIQLLGSEIPNVLALEP